MNIVKDEIEQFVATIGAKEPASNAEVYEKWKTLFKQPNYFVFNEKFMIVKISRSKKPFWGVGKVFIDLFNSLDDYYLVLLISSESGWVFTKREVNANIQNKRWNLETKGRDYKINYPLPDRNSFSSKKSFFKILGLEGN